MYLSCVGGVFHCTLKNVPTPSCTKKQTDVNCQEEPGIPSRSLFQSRRHICQHNPCTQNIQSSVRGKTQCIIALWSSLELGSADSGGSHALAPGARVKYKDR